MHETMFTGEEDFELYEGQVRKSYKEADDWEDFLRNPGAYKGYYIFLSFTIDSADLNLLEPKGVWADLITDDYGRFIIEMPYLEVEEDWGRGFDSDGLMCTLLGQVFRIRVFKALAVYDGYRFIAPYGKFRAGSKNNLNS